MKKIAIIIVFILLAAGIGLFCIYKQLHDPMYTIKQVSTAVSNHDWAVCQKYIDLDAMYDVAKKRKDYSVFQEVLDQTLEDYSKENFANSLKATVEATDDSEGPLKEIQHADSSATKVQIVPMGKIVAVRLWEEFGSFKVPAYTEVVLRSQGLGYIVIDINSRNKHDRTFTVKKLYREFYLYPIEQQLSSSVNIKLTKISEACSNWIFETCFQPLTMIERTVENRTDKNIKEVSFELKLGRYSKYITENGIKAKSSIKSGKKRGWEYNRYIDEDRAWKYAELSSIIIEIQSISFEDGTTLEKDPLAYYTHLNDLAPFDDVISWGKEHSMFEADSLNKWVDEYNSVR